MRIFLLPISTRRTLIYCEKLSTNAPTSASTTPSQSPYTLTSLSDRVVTKANSTWADWERAPKGWKKTLTSYGNRAFRRIPFEEWGLKTLPALHAHTQASAARTSVVFPPSYLAPGKVTQTLRRIAEERQGLHRKRLIGSVVAMPFTIPVGLIPILPNVPFFYLAFRAYSHYKALYGARYLAFLLGKGLVVSEPSRVLDGLYDRGLRHGSREEARREIEKKGQGAKEAGVVAARVEGEEEVMVLKKWNGQLIAEQFKLPGMEIEIERAVEQVEAAIEKATGEANAAKKTEQLAEEKQKTI